MARIVVIAARWHLCSICGRGIPKGSKCYKVKDDFSDEVTDYEHLRCDRSFINIKVAKERRKWSCENREEK